MIKEKKWVNGNINFDIVETETIHDTTIAFGDVRMVLKGKVALEQMTGSGRWGNQVQIVAYGKEIIKEKRAEGTTGYHRVEIALPKEVGEALIKAFSKKHNLDKTSANLTLKQTTLNVNDSDIVRNDMKGDKI